MRRGCLWEGGEEGCHPFQLSLQAGLAVGQTGLGAERQEKKFKSYTRLYPAHGGIIIEER